MKLKHFRKADYQRITDQPAKKVVNMTLDPEIYEWIRERSSKEYIGIGDVIEDLVIGAMANETE